MLILTYWTVTTLLTQMTFPISGECLFSVLHFSDARIHTLGNVIISSALGLWYEQELQLKLADLVRSPSLNNSVTTLALDTRCVVCIFSSPLIKRRNVNNVRSSVAFRFVILQAHIGSAKASILSGKRRKQVPRCWLYGILPGLFFSPLLCNSLFLLLVPHLEFLSLLRRGEDSTEGGWLLCLVPFRGRFNDSFGCWLDQLRIES